MTYCDSVWLKSIISCQKAAWYNISIEKQKSSLIWHPEIIDADLFLEPWACVYVCVYTQLRPHTCKYIYIQYKLHYIYLITFHVAKFLQFHCNAVLFHVHSHWTLSLFPVCHWCQQYRQTLVQLHQSLLKPWDTFHPRICWVLLGFLLPAARPFTYSSSSTSFWVFIISWLIKLYYPHFTDIEPGAQKSWLALT